MKHRLFRSYEPEVLKKLQKEETEVMLVFDELCQAHRWRYFIHYGALIGAVRHQGFIPWDDDIDVAMPREDFEKMKAYMIEHPNLPYGYLDPSTDRSFSKYVPLFYRKGTKFQNDRIGLAPGIGIDVFPFDYVSTDVKKQKKEIKRANFQRRMHYLCYRDPVIPFDGVLYYVVFAICKMARFGIKLLHIDPYKLYQRFETANKKCGEENKKSGWMITFFDADPWKDLIEESVFTTVPLPFEGYELQCPREYDTLLSSYYGADYMQLPPEEKRVNHGAEYILFSDGETIDYSEG